MSILLIALIPLPILVGWLLTIGVFNRETVGVVLYKRPLRFLARLKMLTLPLLASVLLTIAFVGFGWIHVAWCAVPWIVTLAVMHVPADYTLTSSGIRTWRGSFRRWTEFAGAKRSWAGVTLTGVQSRRNYPIFLTGERGDDEFVNLIRTLIRDAYKGTHTGTTSPDIRASTIDRAGGPSGIAAFTTEPR